MTRRTWTAAAFLFCSGASALIYQTVWFREFRLIFGASTFATAAVLAIFMLGLGAGSAILGPRADASERPLAFYGTLEICIAISAALSPLLLWIVRAAYIGLGGSVTLGLFVATIVRLILATLVLAIPTFLMGGTLPAAARAVETDDDTGRRHLALLYGANTLGAVTGTLVSTFYMLESLGNVRTLLAAVAVNVTIGILARIPVERRASSRDEATAGSAVATPVLAASAIVGFAFLLMELVWYRLLTPILGGTTFTFGLILAIALLGIGLGGAFYSMLGRGSFAVTCSLEALAIIVPFALGDRLAVFANLLRSLGHIGFGGDVIGWTIVTLIVVLPPAFIAGIQFPILISLLGEGRDDVGRDVGAAYAWNTGGAIAGSLAGGFGLMPLLSAPGCWRLVAALLVALGVAFAFRERRFVAIAIGVVAVIGIGARGPTAVWRHSGIGAGRAPDPDNINAMRAWIRDARRHLVWDADGRESSIAVLDSDDRVFITNGKADGSARGDAGTQVMAGMIGAIVHANPRTALVIGLGTGSTAGWLASIPTIDRVDVVELEPSVLRVARDMTAVNRDVLHNPKVHIRIADAREVLLTTPRRYDIIFSEPSNPYRAGIASLYTKEFYTAAAARLNRGGMFLQWVQAYDIDVTTMRTIYSTTRSVFPYIDTWRTTESDLLFLSTRDAVVYDVDAIRARLGRDPYGTAMHVAWRVESAEGFFSTYVGNERLPLAIGRADELNTDDKTVVEFGFARSVGDRSRFEINELLDLARGAGVQRPTRVRGAIDWRTVELNRWHDTTLELSPLERDPDVKAHAQFADLYDKREFAEALALADQTHLVPLNSIELAHLAELNADAGRERAADLAEQLRPGEPTEADAILARLRLRQNRDADAMVALERAFIHYYSDPWPDSDIMGHSLDTALELARSNRIYAPRIYALLSEPFSTGQWTDAEKFYRLHVAYGAYGCGAETIAALHALEPDFPWASDLLDIRRKCYRGEEKERAERDFRAITPRSLSGSSSGR